MNIALRRFLNNHGNIATEGSPKSALRPTLIELIRGLFVVYSTVDSTVHSRPLIYAQPGWKMGGGPRVVVSTAKFGFQFPVSAVWKKQKMFLPHPRVKVSIVGSLRDREVACSASDRQGANFESCVWRTVSSQSSHHTQEVLLAQFSLYVHKGGLKPDSFHWMTNIRPGRDSNPETQSFEPQPDRMSYRGQKMDVFRKQSVYRTNIENDLFTIALLIIDDTFIVIRFLHNQHIMLRWCCSKAGRSSATLVQH